MSNVCENECQPETRDSQPNGCTVVAPGLAPDGVTKLCAKGLGKGDEKQAKSAHEAADKNVGPTPSPSPACVVAEGANNGLHEEAADGPSSCGNEPRDARL